MGPEYVYYMLSDAIEALSEGQLAMIAGRYIRLEDLTRQGPSRPSSVLEEVTRFAEASRRGDYYEEFFVNSGNFTTLSSGTAAWISDFGRHLDRCNDAAGTADPRECVEAFEILFGLVRSIDSATENIIFFADDGGSWLFGINWPKRLRRTPPASGKSPRRRILRPRRSP